MRETRRLVAVGGLLRSRGSYRLGKRLLVVAVGARAFVDLSEATFTETPVKLSLVAIVGKVEVILPPGVPYQIHRLALGRVSVVQGAEIRRLWRHRLERT